MLDATAQAGTNRWEKVIEIQVGNEYLDRVPGLPALCVLTPLFIGIGLAAIVHARRKQ